MSVRFSQLLVAIVLALLASVLYRTFNVYLANAAFNELRARGTHVAGHATQMLGRRVASVEALAARTGIDGFDAGVFAQRARGLMRKDTAVQAIDYIDADDDHRVHVESNRRPRGSAPPAPDNPTGAEVGAIEQAVFDAGLSRATSMAETPARARTRTRPDADAQFFLAARVVRKTKDTGTVVAYLEPRRLLLDDLRIQLGGDGFALDDDRGHSITVASEATFAARDGAQTFPIQFADRTLRLTVPQPKVRLSASPWWFVLGWLALVVAICLPIESVGNINRRMQTLNEELEVRVAARTRELETTLQESRRLATVVESVHEGVMWIDSAGVIAYVNAALCEELRRQAQEIVGKRVVDVPALGLQAQQLDEVSSAVRKCGFVYSEIERTRGDDGAYVAGVTFTRRSDAEEGAGGLIAVSRDITERRKLVDQLIGAKGQLEREMRGRADFIGTASHELRTPVTTLRTLAALLAEKLSSRYGLGPDDVRLLEVLELETRRLTHLVDDLLKIAKIDAPETSLVWGAVDLRELVRTEMAAAQLFDSDTGPAVAVRLTDAPARLYGDADALRSILNNLVDNARKFTPAGGRIVVAVMSSADRVRLSVEDSGIGIPQSDLPHIFERFYRVRSAANNAPGSGLGLAIVARLVDLMHGTISVASETGRGTTVSIEFQAASAHASGTAPEEPIHAG